MAEQGVTDPQRHLSKGVAAHSYQFLLDEVVDSPTAAFAYAASMRDGHAQSRELGQNDLSATQRLLNCLSRRAGRDVAILVPTRGHGDTITLGLISASNSKWWRMPSNDLTELIAEDARTADHRHQHQIARRIWHELPEALQKALAPTSPTSFEVLISGDPLWSLFPWELLRFGEGSMDYLGLHRALPRIGSILAPSLERTFAATNLGNGRRMAIVAPHTTGTKPLLGVEIEIEALESRIPEVGGELVENDTTGSAAHDGLMRRAIKASPDMLWYSGHGAIVANEEVLVLHAETPLGDGPRDKITHFGAYQLSEIASRRGGGPLFDHASLVVLNSCMTGRVREHGGQREDLVEAFLKQGAGAVIATALPIFDSVGEALGRAMFSKSAIARKKLGDLVVEVRRQLANGVCADIDRPTWGAWGMVHLHGNAFAAGPFHEYGGNKDEQI